MRETQRRPAPGWGRGAGSRKGDAGELETEVDVTVGVDHPLVRGVAEAARVRGEAGRRCMERLPDRVLGADLDAGRTRQVGRALEESLDAPDDPEARVGVHVLGIDRE